MNVFNKSPDCTVKRKLETLLENRQQHVEKVLGKCGTEGRMPEAQAYLDQLPLIGEIRRILKDAEQPQGDATDIPVYWTDSLFLVDAYKALSPGPVESMYYVTGPQEGNVFALSRICTFSCSQKTSAYVAGDIQSSTGTLIQMDEWGYRLNAWFHSHPGVGPNATMQSSIDMEHQKRLESGNYPAIGGIFTKDGHVRFFSFRRKFRVVIYGKGVEKIDEKLYRIRNIS